ncbi:hypothetical protein AMECASPLE_020495 [Ameca splendens]|uniref:Uncharacterized protein n=1 Tax=Ameca splendens TaxID=208324 RepID=A0ABV0ZYY0_9TELE
MCNGNFTINYLKQRLTVVSVPHQKLPPVIHFKVSSNIYYSLTTFLHQPVPGHVTSELSTGEIRPMLLIQMYIIQVAEAFHSIIHKVWGNTVLTRQAVNLPPTVTDAVVASSHHFYSV